MAAVARGSEGFRLPVTPTQLSAWTEGEVAADDARALPLLQGAVAALRRYCRWHIFPVVADVVTMDGPGGSVLHLPETMRVLSVEAVTDLRGDLSVTPPGPLALTVDVDYDWSELGSVGRLGARWPDRYRALEVSFTHGYEPEDVPDLVQIVLQACAIALSSPMGATQERAGQLGATWATTDPGVAGGLTLLARDRALLDPYRIHRA